MSDNKAVIHRASWTRVRGAGEPAVIVLLWFALATPLAARDLRVTHIANEGFLVEADGAKVIVGGLFDEGIRGYEKIPASLRPALEGALPPFDDVDVILASHHHADHFGPKTVAAYLRANPRAIFVSTPVAVGALRNFLGGESELDSRIRKVLPSQGERERIEIENLSIDVLFLHHGELRRGSVPNLGFLVIMSGAKWLHIGDTEAGREEFRPYTLHLEAIDLAFLPAWFLAEERWASVTEKDIDPSRIIAMHMAESGAPSSYLGLAKTLESRIMKMRVRFPESIVLDRGESLVIHTDLQASP